MQSSWSGRCSVNIESVRLFRRFEGTRYKQKKCSVLSCKVIDVYYIERCVSKIKGCFECDVRA